MTAEQFELWIAAYGPNPIRGLSPARGGRFGRVALVSFRVLGETSNAESMLGAAIESVPEDLRDYYESLRQKAAGVRLRKGGGASV